MKRINKFISKTNNKYIDNDDDIFIMINDERSWLYNRYWYCDTNVYSNKTVIIIHKYLEVYAREGQNASMKVSESYKFKTKITRNTPADDNTKDVNIALP